jgi:uncharacterized protein YjbI with pentapeptide repeats
MGIWLRSWWQKIRKPLEIAVLITLPVIVVALFVLIILGYIFHWDWTGLNGYNNVLTATDITASPQKITKTVAYQPGKTLWDWLQLLIIPAVLAVGGYLFNYTASRNEQNSIRLRDQNERDIAVDNQREAALQAYLDKMSELLLINNLRESKEDEEVRKIARVRTLTVLQRLNPERKGSVLKFLQEAILIDKDKRIVDLSGANLSFANLGEANLSGANLSEAGLSSAYLSGANLSGAYLSGANLSFANLSFANLSGANLRVNIRGADLNGANLSEADLSSAYLSGANLSEANLSRAYLSGANLSFANLSKADLSKANLSGATVTPKQLDTAYSLKGTIMPDGSKHP